MTNSDLNVVVLGSGPSGTAAAKALLLKGIPVTLIDAGSTMPGEAAAIRDSMAGAIPDEWDSSAVDRLNARGLKDRGQVPLKTVFGSDFPYFFDPEVTEHSATILGSRARGGLSNVWGASILPLSEADMAGWPLTTADLAPHYSAVLKWLPHSQIKDELAETYPLYSSYQRKLGLSRQGRALLADLQKAGSDLRLAGVTFGRARLAMSNCFYCGQCLVGCPYEFIYSTNETLEDLRNFPGFRYVGDTLVKGISETADSVDLHVEQGGQAQVIRAERLFLGAGVLNTAKLLMPLLGLREVRIKDSAYNLMPFLRYERTKKVEFESLFTLPQLFMEVAVPEVTQRNTHLQWYSYNELYKHEIHKTLGIIYRAMPAIFPQQIIERMWTIQGFLHSDDSPEIRMLMKAEGRKFDLRAIENPRTRKVFKRVYTKLAGLSHIVGGKPLPIFGRVGAAGASFHAGASFPMCKNPSGVESDLGGRPRGLNRVHVIDSSVLPNIASSTITLSVMANAHRIASDFAEQAG